MCGVQVKDPKRDGTLCNVRSTGQRYKDLYSDTALYIDLCVPSLFLSFTCTPTHCSLHRSLCPISLSIFYLYSAHCSHIDLCERAMCGVQVKDIERDGTQISFTCTPHIALSIEMWTSLFLS